MRPQCEPDDPPAMFQSQVTKFGVDDDSRLAGRAALYLPFRTLVRRLLSRSVTRLHDPDHRTN
jgi:hypothetical protein